MLFTGDSLDAISSKLGLNNMPEKFKQLFLPEKDYVLRPHVFLETKESARYNDRSLRPITSLANNPMIYEAIVNIDKEKLFEIDAEIDRRALMEFAKNTLISELPLEIPGPDTERLGNFELFSFAYESNKDICPIKIEIIREDDDFFKVRTVKVIIKPDHFKKSIFLRCRVRNGKVIIGDQIRLVQDASISQEILFPILENCCEVEVSIWDADNALNQPISLLYERKVHLVRNMQFCIEMQGLKGTLQTPWTKKLSKKSSGESIHNKFERVVRTYSEIGGYENDPWIPAGRSITNLFYNSFPDKSNACFFAKGWQDENSFIKWLQEIAGTYNTRKVMLIDPFFDSEAVSKFLALATFGDIAYEVITDVGFREGVSEKISDECSELKLVLSQQIKIHGLTRLQGGSGQIFHDRFLILFNESDLPKVYMLSNSISGVAKNFPSAVVPVPSDVGCKIVEYYTGLINGSDIYEVPQVTSKLLWPLDTDTSKVYNNLETVNHGIKVFPGYIELIEVLFESGTIPKGQISEDNNLEIAPDEIERIKQFEKLGSELARLIAVNDSKALKLWCGIANWSVRIMDNDRNELFGWLNGSVYREAIINTAELCIREAAAENYPVGVLRMEYNVDSISIAQQCLSPFNHLYWLANSLIEYHYESDYPLVYSVNMAFEYLLAYAPDRAFKALDNVFENVSKMDCMLPTADMAPYFKIISTSLRILANKLMMHVLYSRFPLIRAGLESKITVVRAMCAVAVGRFLMRRDVSNKEIGIDKVIDILDSLRDSVERIYAISWIGYKYQVLRNQGQDNSLVSGMMEYIKKKFIENWPGGNEDDVFLRSTLKNLSGPQEGNKSEDIFDILKRLVENNKIQVQTAVRYIRMLLCEKIRNHLEGELKYYGVVDEPFTHDAVMWLTEVAPGNCNDLIDELDEIVQRAIRIFTRPFARSMDYSKWSNSIEALCWSGIVISHFYKITGSDFTNIQDIYSRIYHLILPYKDEFTDNSGLFRLFFEEGSSAGLIKEGASDA